MKTDEDEMRALSVFDDDGWVWIVKQIEDRMPAENRD
jgi:hypothetical protein